MAGSAEATIKLLEAKIEKLNFQHMQEKNKLHEEIRNVKMKTWCAFCLEEANFFCCWNTAYCGVSCQKFHWKVHQPLCKKSHLRMEEVADSVLEPEEILPDSNLTVSLEIKEEEYCSTNQGSF